MRAVPNAIIQRQQAIAAAQSIAITNAVELSHRYRMARVAAEQEAIRVRRKNNIWNSRLVRRGFYGLFLTLGVGVGWLVANSGQQPTNHTSAANSAGAHAFAPVVDEAAPVSVLKNPLLGILPTAPMSASMSVEASQPNQPMALMDAVEVPFVRSVSQLGRSGLASVTSFAKFNASAQRFTLTGMYGVGETVDIGRARSLSVAEALVAQGIDRTRIEITLPSVTEEESNIFSGARLEARGGSGIKPERIEAGSPLASIEGQHARDLPPAFAPRPSPMRLKSEPATVSGASTSIEPEAEPVEKQSTELEDAVKKAASRKPPSQKSADKPAKAEREGAGVFVRMQTSRPTETARPTPKAQPESPATPAINPATETSYSIIRTMDGAVLVKAGSQVTHVRVGEKLPDGKTLGADLKPKP